MIKRKRFDFTNFDNCCNLKNIINIYLKEKDIEVFDNMFDLENQLEVCQILIMK